MLIIFIVVAIIISKFDTTKVTNTPNNIKKEISHKEFGIDTLLFDKNSYSVKRNETLSKILTNLDLPYGRIYQSQLLAKDIFDLRKINFGNDYYSFTSKDSAKSLAYFVYQISPADFLVLNFNDTLYAEIFKKEIEIKGKTVTGIITNSLYESLDEQNVNPELVISLSEIYAWQIDFYRIMEGDKYKVVFEEEFVDGKSIGINKIIAAEFFHRDESFYAIKFITDTNDNYYDENGNSLRKAFLKAPIKFSRISSRFTKRRLHPVQKIYKAHLGTDYVATRGTPIHSVGDGVIIEAKYSQFNGRYVKVRHNGTYSTQYLHMSKIASGIIPGISVKQGQVIGYVGHTGLAIGDHVCFRFWKNNKQVDPLREKIPSSKPLDKKYINDFNLLKDKIITELNSLKFDENKNSQTASL
ncbi:MAG: peptidase M23 [Ignavibacteriales bacterium CG_4_9_14_3_um_filter_30_11]|nr:MAG: peptidase M23 [Ignavibacteriales bacterium CG_4_9_14_3_um_filter_30_11]